MKRLAILTFALGVIVAPFQAHAKKPVEFNGMVFDQPAQANEVPKAPTAPKSKTSTHQKHARHGHS